MRTGYGMYQQQAARMLLTPQLRQAIRLLQLSTPELLEVVQQELEANPVLEYAIDEASPADSIYRRGQERIGSSDRHDQALMNIADQAASLENHLSHQLNLTRQLPKTIRQAIRYMIGNLDDNGYLTLTDREISERLHISAEDNQQALSVLHGFDPAGVGARSLQECLLLQIRQLPMPPQSHDLIMALIRNHLQDVADYRINKLSSLLQTPVQHIQAAIARIQSLNPRPGAAFHREEVRYIVPDVIIQPINGQFSVVPHDTAMPRLTLSRYYERMAAGSAATEATAATADTTEFADTTESKATAYATEAEQQEVQKFLLSRLNAAKFFVKCVEQRRSTILRVAQAILEEQADFFAKGAAHLKPLTLRQVAEKLAIHESTVSRATAGKYAQTPWGIYELKHFFPYGLQTQAGDSTSAERVKARIKEWVAGENGSKPYSDQKLTDLLQGAGIQISRRTVMKYREELGIPSSVRRKQFHP
ncbi:RNA polymerase factor sigma-54 [Paenibacillus aestuarii]|uniref:RNA polymerase factor sigma-54 n=1 Tax=Paenibacillus aestuarii TaxID=516965 RepID=A0ABW0KG36_9BACL|nr:RNA polymerase factor sigma-54 [Paenibacillus aestuarii]